MVCVCVCVTQSVAYQDQYFLGGGGGGVRVHYLVVINDNDPMARRNSECVRYVKCRDHIKYSKLGYVGFLHSQKL